MSTNVQEFSTQVDRIPDMNSLSTNQHRISDVHRINVNKQREHRIFEADRISAMNCLSTKDHRISDFDRISHPEDHISVPAQDVSQNERILHRMYPEYQVLPERRIRCFQNAALIR